MTHLPRISLVALLAAFAGTACGSSVDTPPTIRACLVVPHDTCVGPATSTSADTLTLQPHDHQAYTGMFGDKASVVVQVVKGKLYVARFTWGPDDTTRDLSVNWAKGDRPLLGFN